LKVAVNDIVNDLLKEGDWIEWDGYGDETPVPDKAIQILMRGDFVLKDHPHLKEIGRVYRNGALELRWFWTPMNPYGDIIAYKVIKLN